MTADLAQRVRQDARQIGKAEIARTVIERLNARGEACLRERREVLRRVVEFTNYDACWPDDQLKAKGLVASIREVVNQRDAFTRMNQAREDERQERLAVVRQAQRAKEERATRIDGAKREFYALFDAQLSPQQLEGALNRLFEAYGDGLPEPESAGCAGSQESLLQAVRHSGRNVSEPGGRVRA
ncbi:MAG: hypothetical protein GEU99_02300 [Luteitalea sp.]|nr:hypothetical protein [Luteitalea sp.]